MEKVTNWLALWEELSDLQNRSWGYSKKKTEGKDAWKDRARHFNDMVKKRWAKPDSSREFIVETLQRTPGATVIDIGAGTGAWSVLMAPHATGVTALEPSAAMQEVLTENLASFNIDNVTIQGGEWPNTEVEPHDFVFASHSMYGCRDFKAFVEKMVTVSRKRCILLLRAPLPDSIMADAARYALGQPYDSPNFQIAFNALLQMGLFPNVLMESEVWDPWTSPSLAEALGEIKRRLGLTEDSRHDDYFMGLLREKVTEENGRVVWPKETRSAMVYWDV
ncbi:MAG: methyltransferase domain-containing protein [Pseudomonadota bacterium]